MVDDIENDLIRRLITQVNNLTKYEDKVLELCSDEYETLMLWANKKKSPLLSNSGYDTVRECYVFCGCDIKRAIETIEVA